MDYRVYSAIEKIASEPAEIDKTIAYVAKQMGSFIRARDHVIICFADNGVKSIGYIFRKAVEKLSGIPVFWDSDHKWKSLLWQTFSSRATVIVGPPLVVLSLSKLAKATGTPLNIRHVITAGYPCLDWIVDGIVRGLDCRTWGCFGPGTGPIVSGFSCGASFGVHIRDDVFDFQMQDENGNCVADGMPGRITVAPRNDPTLRMLMRDHARIERSPCSCGLSTPRLVDIHPSQRFQHDVLSLYQQLHSWTSILDCRVVKGDCGLELELVVFPGEKLPKLPTCAKQVVRAWVPERDTPLDLFPNLKQG